MIATVFRFRLLPISVPGIVDPLALAVSRTRVATIRSSLHTDLSIMIQNEMIDSVYELDRCLGVSEIIVGQLEAAEQ